MWCHDKLIHWLPDSDIFELTDKFQLVNNFTVYETSSQLSIRSLIPKHFCHIMSSYIQSHAEHWNSPSTRLSFRDISPFYFVSLVPKLSISQTENSLSTKACEAAAANRSTAETESWLYAFVQLLSQNSRGLSPIIRLVWISAKYFVDHPYHRCGWRGCISWLVVSAFKMWLELVIEIILVIVIVSFSSIILVIISF